MTSIISKAKVSAQHDEAPDPASVTGGRDIIGCETEFNQLPKGYYCSRFFIGSMMATGLGLWAAVASFVCLSASKIFSYTLKPMKESPFADLSGLRCPDPESNQC